MSVIDQEIIMGHSRVQHGKSNDRIYVMDYKYKKDPYLLNQLHLLAKTYGYGKITAKTIEDAKDLFNKYQFKEEASIPGYYNGQKKCCFMAKYFNKRRKEVKDKKMIMSNLKKLSQVHLRPFSSLSNDYSIRQLGVDDIEQMVRIFEIVFRTYPFPIHDSKFLEKTMADDTIYFGVFYEGSLIGISSCEVDRNYENVEMTDFAIIPAHRGNRLAKHLLRIMENEMKKIGIKTAYTIARSISYPMNATFASLGYTYSGTLWNNTQIAGSIESMNVWHKPLHKSKTKGE